MILLGAGLGLAFLGFLVWVARGKWDLIGRHTQSLVQHALAAILMLGTLTGTFWTLSRGRLMFSGVAETLLSVGGIALALEAGAIFTGMRIGLVDRRIMTAKGKNRRELLAHRTQLFWWFGAVVGLSGAANAWYRWNEFHDIVTVALSATAPVVLIILLTIILRPIPADYTDIGRQAVARGMVGLAIRAQRTLMHGMERIGDGARLGDDELERLRFVAGFLKPFAPVEQQQALDRVVAHGGGASVIDVTPGRYLTAQDVAEQYGVSIRTAQNWISRCQGKITAPRGKGFVAPANEIYAQRGIPASLPQGRELPAPASRRSRRNAQESADTAQDRATDAQSGDAWSKVPERLALATTLDAQIVQDTGQV